MTPAIPVLLLIALPFTLQSVPVWAINSMVTSALGCKHIMPSIKLRAIKAIKFHILMNLYLTGIKKGSSNLLKVGSKMTVSQDHTQ